jgi:hypothetical protein
MVILDLEVQESVDGFERLSIAGHNPHSSTAGRFFVLIGNAVLEPRHVSGPGHLLRVGERRLAEVSSLEQSGDLPKVLSNRVKVGLVAGLLHGDIDSSAVLVEQEVMDRALLIEAHGMCAAGDHVAVMGVVIVRVPLLWLLCPCRGRQPRSGCYDGDRIPESMCHKCLPEAAMLKLNITSSRATSWARRRCAHVMT